jgi:hypothetical protein
VQVGVGQRDKDIEERDDGADGEEEETRVVVEILPTSYVHMGTPIFWQAQNPD